jgi:hypothetical protein
VSRGTFLTWLRDNNALRAIAYRPGKSYLFFTEELQAWLRSQAIGGRPSA